jgi:hypothetical protein
MAETLGRPLAYLSLGLAAWVSGRIYWSLPGDAFQPITPAPVLESATAPIRKAAQSDGTTAASPPTPKRRLPHIAQLRRKASGFTPASDPWQDRGRPSGLPFPVQVADGGKPLSTGRDTPPTNALAPVGKAGTHPTKRRWGGEVYAYSFWRVSTGGGPVLAPGAQYGGSQSGLIGIIDPFGSPDRGLALLLRGSGTPDGSEREVGLGLRWKPKAGWPLMLSAEHRFRDGGPDRFAAYLAGGFDDMPLLGKLKLNGYGQAGYATGRGGGGFFDAQARADYPLAAVGGVPLSVGAGSWAGGQKGAARLDVGPTIAAKVATEPAVLLVRLDWRLRVAGDAMPKDGLALTVSTGF